VCRTAQTFPRERSFAAILIRSLRLAAVSSTARGTFKIDMTPGPPELQGAVDRYDFTKTFYGDLQADGAGLMLSCGDPAAGAAGYVAIETVRGNLSNRRGSFALQQLGMMRARRADAAV
jgi:hypothetical protein